MNHQLKHLICRQQKLQAQAAEQRQDLSENVHGWHTRLRWLDRTIAVAGFVKRHPATLLGVGGLLAMMIPNRSGKMFVGMLAALRALRKVTSLFSKD
jgi:hypothetical protein